MWDVTPPCCCLPGPQLLPSVRCHHAGGAIGASAAVLLGALSWGPVYTSTVQGLAQAACVHEWTLYLQDAVMHHAVAAHLGMLRL